MAKVTRTQFWASTKVFVDIEKASKRHRYEFETSMKCLLKLSESGINALQKLVAPRTPLESFDYPAARWRCTSD